MKNITDSKWVQLGSSLVMALALTLTVLFLPLMAETPNLRARVARAAGEITVTKTTALSQFNQDLGNHSFGYTITVQNSDTPYLAPLTVTDILPAELICSDTSNPNSSKWIHNSSACQKSGVAIYIMSNGRFEAGEQATLTLQVTPALTVDQAIIINRNLTLTGPALGNRVITGTSLSNPLVNAPAWSIQKTAIPTPVIQMGDIVTYSLYVSNVGHYDLLFSLGDTYTVTETLPAGVESVVGWTNLPSTVGYIINAPPRFSWVFTNNGAITPQMPIAISPLTIAVKITTGLTIGDVIVNNNYSVVGGRNVYTGAVGPPISVTVTAPVTLSLTKFADRNIVRPGEWLTYTIIVTNESTSMGPLTNLYITDSLDSNTRYDGWGFLTPLPNSVCTPVPPTFIGCTIKPPDLLAPGQVVSFYVRVQVNFPLTNGTILSNSYGVASAFNDLSIIIHPPTPPLVTTTVQSAPKLDIKKTASADSVKVGDRVTYTIRFTNTGTAVATHVVITDVFQTAFGITVITQTFPIGLLPVNAPDSRTFTVIVPDTFRLTNTVWIDCAEGVTATDTINTMVIKPGPDLQLSKNISTASPATFKPNDIVTYTFRFTNNSNITADRVYVEDILPDNSTFEDGFSSPKWAYVGGIIYRKDVGLLLPGSIGMVDFAIRADTPWPDGVNFITNTGSITYDTRMGYYDFSPANNIATKTIMLAPPDLYLIKSAPPTVQAGEVITYALTYLNNIGSVPATGVVITETLPAHTIFQEGLGWLPVGANQYRYVVGDLAASTAGVISFVVRVDAPLSVGTVVVNQADLMADRYAIPVTATATTKIISSPNLALLKTTSRQMVQAGDLISYTLFYTNQNKVIASGVAISETVPLYTTYIDGTPGWQLIYPNEYVYQVGKLTQSGLLTFVVKVDDSLPDEIRTISNTANIWSDKVDQDPTDNRTNLVIPIYNAWVSTLIMTKDDGGAPVQEGQVIVYTLTYSNIGHETARGLIITETVPAFTTFNATGGSAGWSCRNGAPEGTICSHAVADLVDGDSNQLTFSVIVDRPLPNDLREIINTAIIGDNNYNIGLATKTTPILKPTAIYLPMVMRTLPPKLDLLVSQVNVSTLYPKTGQAVVLEVTLYNAGVQPISTPFWVDLYLATAPIAPTVNQNWDEAFSDSLVPYGVGWRVYPPFYNGVVLTNLVPNDPFNLTKNYSNFIPNGLGKWEQTWKGIPLHNSFRKPGTYYLYVLVDSYGASNGAIAEDNETNNLFGPVIITVSGAALPFEPRETGQTITFTYSTRQSVEQARPTVQP